MSKDVVKCPLCKKSEDLITLAVDLSGEERYESTHLCRTCYVVFGFKPLSATGPVIQIEAVGEPIRSSHGVGESVGDQARKAGGPS